MPDRARANHCAVIGAAAIISMTTLSRADEYHTPLAGAEYHTEVAGKPVVVPARDRDYVRSLNIGGAFFFPEVGSDWGLPFGALYWLKNKNEWRSRAVISLFVNEIDVAREFGKIQLLGHWENDTVPFPTSEIIDGKEIKTSSIEYGTFGGGIGIGYRLQVAPFQSDNALRVRLLYNLGYLYTGRVSETGTDVKLPPSTLVQGFRLRGDYDALRRNILELPHEGWAGGVELEVARRNHSADHGFSGIVFSGDDTRQYFKASAFFTAATGLPNLSERHRLIGILHGGYAPKDTLDRFSAFRLGGGPLPSETEDLYRYWYPGAVFNQFPVSDFLVASLEYRFEILFFLYLHLRVTSAEMNRPYFRQHSPVFSDLDFTHDHSEALSAAVTSGLPWDSQVYAEYTYDSRILRNGKAGSSLLVFWSKSF